jgi:hypothetical protein
MRSVSKVMASAAAFGLVLSSTAAAAAPAATAAVSQPPATNAWLMLTALGPTRSVALGGAAAAAQPANAPPPAVYGVGGPAISGEVIGLILWFALIAVALSTDVSGGRPNTPP